MGGAPRLLGVAAGGRQGPPPTANVIEHYHSQSSFAGFLTLCADRFIGFLAKTFFTDFVRGCTHESMTSYLSLVSLDWEKDMPAKEVPLMTARRIAEGAARGAAAWDRLSMRLRPLLRRTRGLMAACMKATRRGSSRLRLRPTRTAFATHQRRLKSSTCQALVRHTHTLLFIPPRRWPGRLLPPPPLRHPLRGPGAAGTHRTWRSPLKAPCWGRTPCSSWG